MSNLFSNMLNMFNMFSGKKNNKSNSAESEVTKKLIKFAPLSKAKVFILNGHNIDHKNVIIYSCQFANCVNKTNIYCDNKNLVNDHVKDIKQYNKNLELFENYNNQDGVILLTQKPLEQVIQTINDTYEVVYIYQEDQQINKSNLYYAPMQTDQNINKLLKQNVNIVGFSTSNSCSDGICQINQTVDHKTQNTTADMDGSDMINAIKSGNMNFNHISLIFSQMPQMINNPMLKKFQLLQDANTMRSVTQHGEQAIKIINKMTAEERSKPHLLTNSSDSTSRINRIAQDSQTSVEQVQQIIKTLQMLNSNGSSIFNMANKFNNSSNPGDLSNMMNGFFSKK